VPVQVPGTWFASRGARLLQGGAVDVAWRVLLRSGDDAELAADRDERCKGAIEVIGRERGRHLDAHPRGSFGDDGVTEARDEHSMLEEPLREAHRDRRLPEH